MHQTIVQHRSLIQLPQAQPHPVAVPKLVLSSKEGHTTALMMGTSKDSVGVFDHEAIEGNQVVSTPVLEQLQYNLQSGSC